MINSIKITIWEREYTLPVEYEYYDEDIITEAQEKALEKFTLHPKWLSEARSFVEEYCKDEVQADEENSKKDNIFSYIKPDYLFIKRDKRDARVALMCKYRYDMEHGLAVVFDSEGNISVGLQDIIL